MNFWGLVNENGTAQTDNTAYTLRDYALALRDIAPYGRNVVYAGTVMPHIMKMRLFYMIIPILLSCSTAVKIKKSNIENISKTKYKSTCGIVLEKDYVYLFPDEFNGTRFTPNEEDILKAEIILENKIKETNTPNMMNQGDNCPIIHKNLKKYFRQYSGELNTKNEKIIYIKMLWNRFPFWHKVLGYEDQRDKYETGYYFVLDGCSYYWQISINISTEKIELFTVNGVA